MNLNQKKNKIEKDIDNELKLFKDNIVHSVAMTGIIESIIPTSNNIEISSVQSDLCLIEDIDTMVNLEVRNDIDDLVDDLADNLRIMGVSNDYNYPLADIIIASIATNTSLIVNDSADELSDAISYVIDGKPSSKLYFPSNYNNLNQLIDRINSINSKVLLIEGVLDSLNINAYSILTKHCKNKLFIFTVNNSVDIKYIQNIVSNYSLFINTSNYLEVPTDNTLYKYKFDYNKIRNEYSADKLSDVYKVIKRNFGNDITLSNKSLVTLSKVLSMKNISIDFNNLIIKDYINSLKDGLMNE
ncbi:hypothetical protein CM240_2937 [Clostridium bornimense]|uniref:Uncharacterized protein n=1 Tax=Clostridium bornimense TaxID=1216932 RepID=W6S2C6_9CLOT|nr:hypothetical protein [Clostridium bornimense]CDM70054.1 hypothetical protein CM240_2937 [Clostridium bornimense]